MIKNKILKTQLVDWRKLEWLQPKDFKDDNPEIIDKLKTSLKNNGFASPFHVWKNKTKIYICDGSYRHMVLNEMLKEGIKIPDKLPANFIDCKNKTEAKKMVLVYNSHYATINENSMIGFLDGMDIDDLDLEINIPDIDLLNLGDDDVIEDDPPPIPDKPKSKLGDIYELGRHRVICGDSTDEAVICKLLQGKKIDMVFTDPPYGVDYAKKNEFLNKIDKGNRNQKSIKNDNLKQEEVAKILLNSFKNIVKCLKTTNSFYVFAAQGPDLMMMMMMMMMEAGLNIRHTLIWAKNNHVLGRSDYNYKHEPIIYGWNNKHKFYGNGSQKTSVWNFDKPLKNDLHPTMKPISLIVNAILNSTLKDMIVFDGFLGSGSTLIACEQTDRICCGIEIEPCYIDVIVQRYVNFTGNEKIKKNGKSIIWKQTNKSDGDK